MAEPVGLYDVDDGRNALQTHLEINRTLCGEVLEMKVSYAKISLTTTQEMSVDSHGLVHGGFIFGAADFAAMAAVNDPNVVLVEANTKFLAPIEVGKSIIFEATASHETTRSRFINVIGKLGDIKAFEGDFKAVILDRHVLRLKLVD